MRARIESHKDDVKVELWSRAHIANGITYPRVPRNWVLLNHKDLTDQDILDRQRELEGRGFRHERTVDERPSS